MTDLEVLTETRAWCATPQDYNSLVSLRFREDGTGDMCFGYGQRIHAKIDFQFTLPQVDRLTIIYLPTPEEGSRPAFKPKRGHGSKLLSYRLKQGEVTGAAPNSGPFKFHWTLQLGGSPFPDELSLPDLTRFGYTKTSPPTEYYGHNENEIGERPTPAKHGRGGFTPGRR